MHYIVEICCPRQKVTLIKLFRAMLGGTDENWGLKASKDYIEEQFCFDSWMEVNATFEVTITATQLGRLSNHVINAGAGVEINTCKLFDQRINAFDFTDV